MSRIISDDILQATRMTEDELQNQVKRYNTMSKIVQEITADGLHLSKELIEQFGWREGTRLVLEISNRTVSIIPQDLTAEDIEEIASSFLLAKVGDAIGIKKPQKKGDKWFVDVILPHSEKYLGVLVYTDDGVVISDESDKISKIIEKANEN